MLNIIIISFSSNRRLYWNNDTSVSSQFFLRGGFFVLNYRTKSREHDKRRTSRHICYISATAFCIRTFRVNDKRHLKLAYYNADRQQNFAWFIFLLAKQQHFSADFNNHRKKPSLFVVTWKREFKLGDQSHPKFEPKKGQRDSICKTGSKCYCQFSAGVLLEAKTNYF